MGGSRASVRHKYTNTQIHKYTNTQIQKSQMHKYKAVRRPKGGRKGLPGGKKGGGHV